jgi:hypothetical protein
VHGHLLELGSARAAQLCFLSLLSFSRYGSAMTSPCSRAPHRASSWPESAYRRQAAPPRHHARRRARSRAPSVPALGASGPPHRGEAAGGDHTTDELTGVKSRPVSAAPLPRAIDAWAWLTHGGPLVSASSQAWVHCNRCT